MGVRIKSEMGMGIIEVLIASSMLSVILAGMASMTLMSHRSQNGVKYKSDSDNLTEEIRAMLSNSQACSNSFNGLVARPGASHSIRRISNGGSMLYEVGSIHGDRSVRIASLTLTSFLPSPAPNRARMTLLAHLKSIKDSAGASDLVRAVNVDLNLDGSSRIVSCLALAKMTDGIWQRTQSDPSNISFNSGPSGGNVGISNPNPVSKLDVSGEIRISSTGAACTLANEGALRYNTTGKTMEFCNGTNWGAVGGANQGRPAFLGRFACGVSGRTFVNSQPYPVFVTASGGNSVDVASTDNAHNRCHLSANVSGVTVAHSANNNDTYAKTCSIAFMVPANHSYMINSAPWDAGNGDCAVTEFR